MSKGWTPPKGISVIYKAKGHRKKAQRDEHETNKEKAKKDKDSD